MGPRSGTGYESGAAADRRETARNRRSVSGIRDRACGATRNRSLPMPEDTMSKNKGGREARKPKQEKKPKGSSPWTWCIG